MFSLYLPDQMVSALKAAAAESGLSVSELVRRAIDDFLRKCLKH